MPSLLDLPAELRLDVYSLAVSSQPYFINIDEGATSLEPPRSAVAKSLASIDKHLSGEIFKLYWSNNVFETYLLSGMGHYIATDCFFHQWLCNTVKDAAPYIRHLRFKGMLRIPLDHEYDCIMTVDIDVKRQMTRIRTKTGRKCTCEHVEELASRMSQKLSQIPVVEGQVQPSLSTLWDIFDCWFTYHPVHSRRQRTWDEFQLQYGRYEP